MTPPLPPLPSSLHLSCFPLLRYTCMYTLLHVVFPFKVYQVVQSLMYEALRHYQEVLLVGTWTLNSLCHSMFLVSGQVLRNSWSLEHQSLKELFLLSRNQLYWSGLQFPHNVKSPSNSNTELFLEEAGHQVLQGFQEKERIQQIPKT